MESWKFELFGLSYMKLTMMMVYSVEQDMNKSFDNICESFGQPRISV